MTDKIQIGFLKTSGGFMIACITLNKPKALNALDVDMLNAMQFHLDAWRNDESVAAIFIDSEGDKAFCAGGDIVSMYQAMINEDMSPEEIPDFMTQFLELEYRLDYSIHAFPKPIICWGKGIIMGGGLGVFAGASHKIVTETSRVAMPEITIGLFPDVGASYFLNKLPEGVGKFLGLTASSINGIDCINIGLADYFLLNDSKAHLLFALSKVSSCSSNNISATIKQVFEECKANEVWSTLTGKLTPVMSELNAFSACESTYEVSDLLRQLKEKYPQNKLLSKALLNFQNGSPISARLVIEQLDRGAKLCLAECFQMELSMAYQCSVTGEFKEGVRALMIDKDNNPRWLYRKGIDIPDELIMKHFTRFDPQGFNKPNEKRLENPLYSLVTDYGEA